MLTPVGIPLACLGSVHNRAALSAFCEPGTVTERWAGHPTHPCGAQAMSNPSRGKNPLIKGMLRASLIRLFIYSPRNIY